jgi:hypothetical protein
MRLLHHDKKNKLNNILNWAVRVQHIHNLTTSLRLSLFVRETLTPDQHEILLLHNGLAQIYDTIQSHNIP